MYEVFFVVLLILLFGAYILYVNVWVPKVINKHSDFFNVKSLNKKILTWGKKFFVFLYFIYIVMIYDNAYKFFEDGTSEKIGNVVLYLLLMVVTKCIEFLLYRKKYACLPFTRNMNMLECVKSIENERFTQIGEKIWSSASWIRISTRFFPKSAIMAMGSEKKMFRHATATILVYTVDGQCYRCNDFDPYDEKFDENVTKLGQTLPINMMVSGEDRDTRIWLKEVNVSDRFDAYMKSHSTTEFIFNPDFIQNVVNIRREVVR